VLAKKTLYHLSHIFSPVQHCFDYSCGVYSDMPLALLFLFKMALGICEFLCVHICFEIFFGGGGLDCGLNSGVPTCKAGTLLLGLHLQSILIWLLGMGSFKLCAQAGLKLPSSLFWSPK
jgi:hypothetical protein